MNSFVINHPLFKAFGRLLEKGIRDLADAKELCDRFYTKSAALHYSADKKSKGYIEFHYINVAANILQRMEEIDTDVKEIAYGFTMSRSLLNNGSVRSNDMRTRLKDLYENIGKLDLVINICSDALSPVAKDLSKRPEELHVDISNLAVMQVELGIAIDGLTTIFQMLCKLYDDIETMDTVEHQFRRTINFTQWKHGELEARPCLSVEDVALIKRRNMPANMTMSLAIHARPLGVDLLGVCMLNDIMLSKVAKSNFHKELIKHINAVLPEPVPCCIVVDNDRNAKRLAQLISEGENEKAFTLGDEVSRGGVFYGTRESSFSSPNHVGLETLFKNKNAWIDSIGNVPKRIIYVVAKSRVTNGIMCDIAAMLPVFDFT